MVAICNHLGQGLTTATDAEAISMVDEALGPARQARSVAARVDGCGYARAPEFFRAHERPAPPEAPS